MKRKLEIGMVFRRHNGDEFMVTPPIPNSKPPMFGYEWIKEQSGKGNLVDSHVEDYTTLRNFILVWDPSVNDLIDLYYETRWKH